MGLATEASDLTSCRLDTAEGTFLYKVKAIYIDGTESEWSNIEEVTLFENLFIKTKFFNENDIMSDRRASK